jgi:hypothetical protein
MFDAYFTLELVYMSKTNQDLELESLAIDLIIVFNPKFETNDRYAILSPITC